ncbi:MAG TPA: hypothetical protein VEB70_09390, partial [Noviherbaspirillum sp.]|nr:hypothetical protein [Noviherbaspirillum sp.]
ASTRPNLPHKPAAKTPWRAYAKPRIRHIEFGFDTTAGCLSTISTESIQSRHSDDAEAEIEFPTLYAPVFRYETYDITRLPPASMTCSPSSLAKGLC